MANLLSTSVSGSLSSTGRISTTYNTDRYQFNLSRISGSNWWFTNDSDKLGLHLNNVGDRIYFATDGNIWSSYYNDWLSNIFNSKQNASTAITTSNIGSQSVASASQVSGVAVSAAQAQALKNTLDSPTLPYKCDIYVEGDGDKFYPVHFMFGDQDIWRRIIIRRGYGEEAPWDPIGTGVHHGGLLLDWEGNFGGWGGAEYSDRLRVFNESYTNVCADMFIYTHSMGYVFMLRGGHALYHIFSDQPIRGYYQEGTPDIAYNSNTLFYDDNWSGNNTYDVYAPRPLGLSEVNSSRIDGLRTKKQSLFDNRYLRQGVDISGIGTISSTNFLASNAYYLNGTSYYLNSTNGGIYTNARFEAAGNLHIGGSSQFNGNVTWFSGTSTLALENGGTFARFAFNRLDFYDWQHGVQLEIDSNYVYVNNYLQAGNSLRAPIFYDSNDTNYYVDPNGVSRIYRLQVIGDWSGSNPNEGAINIRGNYPSMTFRNTISGNMWLRHMDGAGDIQHYFAPSGVDANDWSIKHSMRTDGTFQSNGSMRSPIFYDSENTGYYLDPNSQSNLLYVTMPHRGNGVANIVVNTGGSENWNAINVRGGANDHMGIGYHGTSRSVFGTDGMSIHFDETDSFRLHTNGWDTEFEVTGDGRAWLKDRLGLGTTDFSYTANDNSRTVGSTTNNKLFVNGSIQLLSNNDAIVIGRGTATFLSDEELGFGWGGGWYMTESSYIRSRGSKSLHMNYGSVDYVGSLYLEGSGVGAHLQPNAGSLGSLQVTGSKNGWHGIRFTGSDVNLMANANEVGFHNNAVGWQFLWSAGTAYVYKGGTGGGTQATVLDTANAFYAWNMNQYVRTSDSPTFQSLFLPQNPVGTTYGNGVSATPPNRIEQRVGNDDGWRIYGEAGATNEVRMVFELIDDIETAYSDQWVFRNKLTYGAYTARNEFQISGNGDAQARGSMRAPIFYSSVDTNYFWEPNVSSAHRFRTANGYVDIGPMNSSWCHFQTDRANFYFGSTIYADASGFATYGGSTSMTKTDVNSPMFLVTNHSDNTKGYRIQNTSGISVSAMFTNSSNQLVIAAGALDQINLNKKVYVNGVALGVNVAPSATAGRIDASNDIVAYSSSDERLKENIAPIENALDKVKSLTGVEFDWKPEYKHAHGYEGHDTGIIAQQVEAVMPSAVRTNDTGFLAVRYEKLIGLLIEGMKEQQAQIDELKAKLDGLTK